jgi:ribonuclease P protein component
MSESKRTFTLKRAAILKHKADIELLFAEGKRTNQGAIKTLVLIRSNCHPNLAGLKFFVSVPKRLIHNATDRNTLKRRIKEAYRLNYSGLKKMCCDNNVNVFFGVVYIKNYIEEYNIIEQKIVLYLQNIYNDIYENLQKP